MTDEIAGLKNAGPGNRRTKSQGWKMQDLENDGPRRRGVKMQDLKMTEQIAELKNERPVTGWLTLYFTQQLELNLHPRASP